MGLPRAKLSLKHATGAASVWFASFTVDLDAIADWLTACDVDTVAMEPTGVYADPGPARRPAAPAARLSRGTQTSAKAGLEEKDRRSSPARAGSSFQRRRGAMRGFFWPISPSAPRRDTRVGRTEPATPLPAARTPTDHDHDAAASSAAAFSPAA